VRIDNHRSKSLHFNIDDEQPGKPLPWVSLETTRQFFLEKVYQRFGYFDYE